MPKRYIIAREDHVLTPMTLNLFKGIAQIMIDGDTPILCSTPDREIKEFGRLCLALLGGKDIFFTRPSDPNQM